jgi:hypothetical protein
MSPEIWTALDEMFAKHPITKAEPVPYEEIDQAAMTAGVHFPQDYREFIHRYGGAIVGPYPVVGLRKAKAMARTESSVFDVTEQFWRQGWRGVNDWLVISIDHAGNPIGLDKDGKIWISDHDAGLVEVIASTFEEYLRTRCLNLSGDN